MCSHVQENFLDEVIPPKVVTATVISDGNMTAFLSWTTPAGDRVELALPDGEHEFTYVMTDGTTCILAVTVKPFGKWVFAS